VIRTIIVDDEPLARQRVRDLLTEEHDFEIVGECEDGFDAAARIPRLHPDVVYLDVQMPGMNGFEVLQTLAPELPVIVFTTAYDSYAVQAFEATALDYLLKPIDAGRFHKSAARVRAAMSKRTDWSEKAAALLAQIEQRDPTLRRIAVKNGGRILFVDVADVDWFEAAGNYVRVHTAKSAYLVRTTMAALERKLDKNAFVRIHRSVIINVARITELEARFRGDYVVVLRSGKKLDLQRAYAKGLRAVMGEF
jgi:two-component system LytT family response regulator